MPPKTKTNIKITKLCIATIGIKSRALIVNIDGYWDNLFKLFNDLVSNEFMKQFNLQNFTEVKSEVEIENEIKELI